MLSPKRVIVDTSALYALTSATDAFHTQAKSSYERLLDWEWELCITSYILVETSALMHHRLGFQPLITFMETALSDVVRIVWVENTIHGEAWRRMMRRQGRDFSLVDWTTMVVAEQLKASVFTFDQGFRHEGILIFPH
ncbi:MAG: PIN domain-containing protein [Chloroflexota bacterium]